MNLLNPVSIQSSTKDSPSAINHPNPSGHAMPLSPASSSSVTAFSGPIPPPEFLKQYELLVPGIAKQFLEGPILEAEHRRTLEKQAVAERIRASKTGQKMAFSLALTSIIGAFTAIFLGYSIAGLGGLLIAAASFATVFIYSNKQHG